MDRLPEDGTERVTHHLGKTIRKEDTWARVMDDVGSADTVILSFPLYWDALPSHTTRALELMAAHRREVPPERPQTLMVIVNNGFPEPWHNQVVLRVCRRFADEAGFTWGGGLNVGGGGAINGRPVEQAGGVAIRLRDNLDKITLAIARGEPLTKEMEEAMAQQLYPGWVSRVFGGFGWRSIARKQGASRSLKDRPYE
jgi:hypothetical protein